MKYKIGDTVKFFDEDDYGIKIGIVNDLTFYEHHYGNQIKMVELGYYTYYTTNIGDLSSIKYQWFYPDTLEKLTKVVKKISLLDELHEI